MLGPGRSYRQSFPGETARKRGAADGKKKLKEDFDREVAREITMLIGKKAIAELDLEAIEVAARRHALRIAARAIEQRINDDRTDYTEAVLACPCGGKARYVGRRNKTFKSVLGDLVLCRAYYCCKACGNGVYPRDKKLGLEQTSLTPALLRMVGLSAALVSFQESSELLQSLAGVPVDPKQVERTAEALGRDIEHDESTVVTAEAPSAPTMYLGMDGTGIPMRKKDLEGRPGKQNDGSSKTREVKLVTVWTAEGRDKDGIPVRDQGSISYSAAIESAACKDTDQAPPAFAQRVLREACRRGFDRATRSVILGDGAKWIWNLADEHFPDATQIVDLFHAKQNLSTVAKAIFGAGSDLSTQWAALRHDELDAGKIPELLAALRVHSNNNEDARKCLDYFNRNRLRLRYPEFRAMGLCVSSGVVEAGCKVAIGTRLKRAGMHWSLRGANAIIALRTCKLSGRLEDYWQRRADRASLEQAAA